MQRTPSLFLVLSALVVLAGAGVSGSPPLARAQDATTIRFAISMPASSPWDRIARAWNNSLSSDSAGALAISSTVGSAAGPENDFVADIAAGRRDAAMITSLALGRSIPAVRVLEAPGAVSADHLDAARAAVAAEIDAQLAAQDLVRLGWLDFGDVRIFSASAVAAPSDLAARHTWAHPDDDVVEELLRASGASGTSLTLDRVLSGLGAGTIDTVFASAFAVSGMTWSPHFHHVSDRVFFHAGGMTVMRRSTYLGLSTAARAALDSTAASAHRRLASMIRTEDAHAYTALTGAGIAVTTTTSAWGGIETTARGALVPRVYSRALLTSAENAR